MVSACISNGMERRSSPVLQQGGSSPKPDVLSSVRVCSLNIHDSKFSPAQLVLNPEAFPDVSLKDYLEISTGNDRIVLQVLSLHPIKSGKLQISLNKSVADAFNFQLWQEVRVRIVDGSQAEVDFVELTFRNQYLTRGYAPSIHV